MREKYSLLHLKFLKVDGWSIIYLVLYIFIRGIYLLNALLRFSFFNGYFVRSSNEKWQVIIDILNMNNNLKL